MLCYAMPSMSRATLVNLVKSHKRITSNIRFPSDSIQTPPSVHIGVLPQISLQRMISTSSQVIRHQREQNGLAKNVPTSKTVCSEYARAIQDLNLLQSNTQAVALAKYKDPQQILPLFERQLNSAGIKVEDLDRLKIIHVSGTKGKGSTCAFLESILRGEGLKTGFYNSPHLIKVTERIKLNGQQINEQKFSKHFRYIYDRLQRASKEENISLPSYFSFLTILAYHIFLEEKVDCAIIEVGIGGQYDPTNIVRKPVACGITSIHFDHTNILGDTIESIARSKAGIAKTNVPIFTVDQEHAPALDVIRRKAEQDDCPLFICRPIRGAVKLGINGTAQYENASLACQLGNYFVSKIGPERQKFVHIPERTLETKLDDMPSSFARSLVACSWPGRCQIIEYSRVSFYLDGAHTKESMENCLDWYSSEAESQHIRILMVNIIGDRNKYEILRPLAKSGRFNKVIFSTNRINSLGDTPKSETFVNMQTSNNDKSLENVLVNAKTWGSLVEGQNCPSAEVKTNIAEGLESVIDAMRNEPEKSFKILITGSLHFVGAVLETLPSFDKIMENS